MTNTRIIKLAATAAPATKTAARAALKAAGLKQTLADDLLTATEHLASLRKHAKAARIDRHLGYCPVDANARRWTWTHSKGQRGNGIAVREFKQPYPTRPLAVLPKGTPAERLATIRRQAVANVYENTYRQAAHGDVCVILTTDPAAVGVRQVESVDYDLYKGAYKGRAARVQDTTITAPATWRVRVQRAGLAVVDGMMTLDAARIESTGCELYAAAWIVQGRCTSVSVQRGYIARAGALSYHGATADQAMTGLARKARELAFSAHLNAADLGELVAHCPSARVSVADARKIGACEYGIKSWCAAVGLDYDAGSATLGDVYAAYQREPRPEARATILHALRRNRAALAA